MGGCSSKLKASSLPLAQRETSSLRLFQKGALRDGKGPGFMELGSRKEELRNPWELSLLNAVELGVFAAVCKLPAFFILKNGRIKTILLTRLRFADLFKAKQSK